MRTVSRVPRVARLEAGCQLAKERKCFSLAHSENLLLDNSGIQMGCTHALDAKPKQAEEKKGPQISAFSIPTYFCLNMGYFSFVYSFLCAMDIQGADLIVTAPQRHASYPALDLV